MTIARGEPMLAEDILNLTFFPRGTILMYDGAGWQDNVTLKGWYKCDAANAAAGRTPDLENRFIRGGTVAKDGRGDTGGGTATIAIDNLPVHSHGLTGLSVSNGGAHGHTMSGTIGEAGSHNHTVSGTTGNGGGHSHTYSYITLPSSDGYNRSGASWAAYDPVYSSTATSIVADHSHGFSGTASSVAAHSHGFSGSVDTVSDHAHGISGSIGNTGRGQAISIVPSYYTLIYIRKVD